MRSFQEISDDLKNSISAVIEKQTKLDTVTKEADALITKAESMKVSAAQEFATAKDKANKLMVEHEQLLSSIFGDPSGRVRQSK